MDNAYLLVASTSYSRKYHKKLALLLLLLLLLLFNVGGLGPRGK